MAHFCSYDVNALNLECIYNSLLFKNKILTLSAYDKLLGTTLCIS